MAYGGRMQIIGKEKSLDEVTEGVIILNQIIEENRYNYRKSWRAWLPQNVGSPEELQKATMAYVPVVAMRKCRAEAASKNGDSPYFIFVLNQARDQRPKSAEPAKTAGNDTKSAPEKEAHCKLCKNILDADMKISEIDDYYLTSNGFPYHNYASLLINKHRRPQTAPLRPEEIATWMKTSILLDQYIFFNAWGAGASIKEHQHAQVVDLQEMQMDNKIIPLPILNSPLTTKIPVGKSLDVFRLKDYVLDALVFTGTDAPYKAAYATKLLSDSDASFNLLVYKNEVYVIGRNKSRETSICMCRKVGGYEISGVAMLGDIEEKSGERNITIKGARVFSNMAYEIARKNIGGATIMLDTLVRKFA